MFGAIGLPELLIIAAAGLLIFGAGTLSARVVSYASAAAPFRTADGLAVADWPYAHGVRAGALAELFGLGVNGIRWPQVVVVLIGTWLSGNGATLFTAGMDSFSAVNLAVMTAWPITFVFAAITAIRSFQSGVAVAIATGVLHSLLFTSIRYVASGSIWSIRLDQNLMQVMASSLLWPVLTMFALALAVSGRARWTRMAFGLTVASFAQIFLINGLYTGSWDPTRPLTDATAITREIVSAIVWTAAFWFGEAKYGRTLAE